MSGFVKIDPYLDGIEVFETLGERRSQLSNDDLSFIGGVLKKYCPKKVLEIGVAAGGTSVFILDCIQKLGLDAMMYSVDLADTFHQNRNKKCGYQIDDLRNHREIKHKLYLGKPIASVIEEIAADDNQPIDLVIMDTTHYMPGECLDFLICAPFLSPNAVVIMDDLNFAHFGEKRYGFATRVLNSSIVADQLYLNDLGKDKMLGFRLNSDSQASISNAFSALMIPWAYSLGEYEADYQSIIEKFYDEPLASMYLEAVALNQDTLGKDLHAKKEIRDLLTNIADKNVYIYGAGQRGQALRFFMENQGKEVKAFIVSDDRVHEPGSAQAVTLKDVVNDDNRIIVVAAANCGGIISTLEEARENYLIPASTVYPFIKLYYSLLS